MLSLGSLNPFELLSEPKLKSKSKSNLIFNKKSKTRYTFRELFPMGKIKEIKQQRGPCRIIVIIEEAGLNYEMVITYVTLSIKEVINKFINKFKDDFKVDFTPVTRHNNVFYSHSDKIRFNVKIHMLNVKLEKKTQTLFLTEFAGKDIKYPDIPNYINNIYNYVFNDTKIKFTFFNKKIKQIPFEAKYFQEHGNFIWKYETDIKIKCIGIPDPNKIPSIITDPIKSSETKIFKKNTLISYFIFCFNKDIKSVRDLNKSHISMLTNIKKNFIDWFIKKFKDKLSFPDIEGINNITDYIYKYSFFSIQYPPKWGILYFEFTLTPYLFKEPLNIYKFTIEQLILFLTKYNDFKKLTLNYRLINNEQFYILNKDILLDGMDNYIGHVKKLTQTTGGSIKDMFVFMKTNYYVKEKQDRYFKCRYVLKNKDNTKNLIISPTLGDIQNLTKAITHMKFKPLFYNDDNIYLLGYADNKTHNVKYILDDIVSDKFEKRQFRIGQKVNSDSFHNILYTSDIPVFVLQYILYNNSGDAFIKIKSKTISKSRSFTKWIYWYNYPFHTQFKTFIQKYIKKDVKYEDKQDFLDKIPDDKYTEMHNTFIATYKSKDILNELKKHINVLEKIKLKIEYYYNLIISDFSLKYPKLCNILKEFKKHLDSDIGSDLHVILSKITDDIQIIQTLKTKITDNTYMSDDDFYKIVCINITIYYDISIKIRECQRSLDKGRKDFKTNKNNIITLINEPYFPKNKKDILSKLPHLKPECFSHIESIFMKEHVKLLKRLLIQIYDDHKQNIFNAYFHYPTISILHCHLYIMNKDVKSGATMYEEYINLNITKQLIHVINKFEIINTTHYTNVLSAKKSILHAPSVKKTLGSIFIL